jgi:hypothetical protein
MSIYLGGDVAATPARDLRPRRRADRIAHSPHWVDAARTLRAAVRGARPHAGWRRSATADLVGIDIINHIVELNPRDLHVLAVVFGILRRTSSHDQ